MKKIMISGPVAGYETQRQTIIKAVQNAGFHAIAYEYASASESAHDVNLDLVQSSDVLICYFSDRLGARPIDPDFNPDGLSWSELEFDEAKKLGKPVLAFDLSSAAKPGNTRAEPQDLARANSFREKVYTHQLAQTIPVDDEDALTSAVIQSLLQLSFQLGMDSSSKGQQATRSVRLDYVLEEQKIPLLFVSQIVRNELARLEEQIRKSNSIDPVAKTQLHAEIERLLSALNELIEKLDQPSTEEDESWSKEFSREIRNSISNLCDAKHVASITVPTGLILGCGALGAMLGGPVGFGAGSVFGHLLSGQMKPGAATTKLEDTFNDSDG